jgi:Trk K+ transport system NAD-binding subunit
MHLILVGAGGVTRDLLRGLGEHWSVTVVDVDSQRLALAAGIRPLAKVVGDGSSRVVLERAGLSEADALVATTNSDPVNQEACRIARESGLLRVVSVAADPEGLGDYRALGIPAFSPDRLTARRIEINLEPRRIASAAFADGMAEAVEFRIEPDSPLVGRSLQDLHSTRSLIAAVLRSGELIVPHGSTILKAGDLVTVVGAAADYSDIVSLFTAGTARFPASFGHQVALLVESEADLSDLLPEAVVMTRNSAADSVLVLHPRLETIPHKARMEEVSSVIGKIHEYTDEVRVRLRPVERGESFRSVIESESVGIVVVRAPEGGRLSRRIELSRCARRIKGLKKPVLYAAGRAPYRHIVVEAGASDTAGRAAIDLTSYGNTRLIAVAAVPPPFMAGDEALTEAKEEVSRIREEAAVKDVAVKRLVRRGNPVRTVTDVTHGEGLLVLPMPAHLPTGSNPGITGHFVLRAGTSVLLVPPDGT